MSYFSVFLYFIPLTEKFAGEFDFFLLQVILLNRTGYTGGGVLYITREKGYNRRMEEKFMQPTESRGIKAVFWDIDGTLIDSEELHYQVIVDWCREQGYTLRKEDNDALLGKSNVEKYQILSTIFAFDSDLLAFKKAIARRYCDSVSQDLQRQGPVAVFHEIAKAGVPQACVSNGDMVVVRANLDILGLSDLVSFCLSGDDVQNGKPDPEPYLLAAAKQGVAPSNCLVVEDSLVGVASGIAAGMIVVAWPEEGTRVESYRNADYFVTDRKEFPRHLLPLA